MSGVCSGVCWVSLRITPCIIGRGPLRNMGLGETGTQTMRLSTLSRINHGSVEDGVVFSKGISTIGGTPLFR